MYIVASAQLMVSVQSALVLLLLMAVSGPLLRVPQPRALSYLLPFVGFGVMQQCSARVGVVSTVSIHWSPVQTVGAGRFQTEVTVSTLMVRRAFMYGERNSWLFRRY